VKGSTLLSSSGVHISKLYVQAQFSLAEDLNIIDDIKTDLDALMVFADEEKDFLPFLDSPYFNTDSKKKLIEKVFSDRLNEITMNFLFVVIKNGRVEYLPLIIDGYSQLWFEHYHCCPVTATTSEPLSDERIRNLSHQIAAAIQRNIELKVVADPSIIGGVIIRYCDNVIDNSVRKRLTEAVKTIKSRCRERGRIDEI
jgi:F-type H+-transporting ATPase subunit delta